MATKKKSDPRPQVEITDFKPPDATQLEQPPAKKRGTHKDGCKCVACAPKAGAAKRHAAKAQPGELGTGAVVAVLGVTVLLVGAGAFALVRSLRPNRGPATVLPFPSTQTA